MKNYIKLIALSIALVVFACNSNEDGYADYPEVNSEQISMSGDWWIVALQPDGTTAAFGGSYQKFTISNTSKDTDSIWIDDHGNWMEIKTKVKTNLNDLTFSGKANADELITGGKVSVNGGKIWKNIVTVASKSKVDSIYFEAEFDWAPGTVYKFAGHKRSGFSEDENPSY